MNILLAFCPLPFSPAFPTRSSSRGTYSEEKGTGTFRVCETMRGANNLANNPLKGVVTKRISVSVGVLQHAFFPLLANANKTYCHT